MSVAKDKAPAWKLILLSVGWMFLICSASRIWSFCLLLWCFNIVVLSVRIFRKSVVGHECFLTELMFKLVLMYLNVFSYWHYYRNTFKSIRYTLRWYRRSYIVVMQKQKLHRFCNRSSPDDRPKSERKYFRYIQLWKIHQSIPTEYDKSNTAIWTNQQKNM